MQQTTIQKTDIEKTIEQMIATLSDWSIVFLKKPSYNSIRCHHALADCIHQLNGIAFMIDHTRQCELRRQSRNKSVN